MIAEVVRKLRENSKYSAKDLGVMIGRNKTYISQIEHGKIQHPHLPSLKKLLSLLGCNKEEIEEIILNEFEDLDEYCKSSSRNKIDYIMEKKIILNKRNDESSNGKSSFEGQIMTRKAFRDKCQLDAYKLYSELQELPKETLDLLINMLYEDI